MRLSTTEAALLSDSERKLVLSKGPWHVKDLVKVIQRTRSLRDKQADMVRRQTISTARRSGSKSGVSGVANARTAAKGRVFERALQEFEAQLAAINVESSDACKSLLGGASSKPAPAAKRSAAKSTATGNSSKTAANSKAAAKPAKAAQTATGAKAAKPSKPAKATKAAKPVKAATTAKAAKPVKAAAKPGKPAKPAKAATPAKPARPAKPAKADKPAKPEQTAKADAANPVVASQAVARLDPKLHRPGKVRIALPLNPTGSSSPQLSGQASRRTRGMKTR